MIDMNRMEEGTSKTVLGKGLASLLAPAEVIESNRDRHPGISFASVEEIQANPQQPRREFDPQALEDLAQSIRTNGVIQPLIVRKVAQGYELIAGERRLRAARLAGLSRVPVVIRRSTDRESLQLALIENIQRQDLSCIEEAQAYQHLLEDFTLTQEEIALQAGKDRATVANHLRLLKLETPIQGDLRNGALSFGHAKVLLSVEGATERLRLHSLIIEQKLSVRGTEALVAKEAAESAIREARSAKAENSIETQSLTNRFNQLSRDLTHLWGARVTLRGTEDLGKVVFHYTSRDDLDRILEKLQSGRAAPND